jgi:hypothetical protein
MAMASPSIRQIITARIRKYKNESASNMMGKNEVFFAENTVSKNVS